MKSSDRMILIVMLSLALLVGFYILVLGPKRSEASKLGDEISELQASVDEQEQVAAFAEQARQEFPDFYGRVVVLGKAVPEGADSASLLVQLSAISDRSGVKFNGIELGGGAGAGTGTTTAPPAEGTTTPAAPTTTTGSEATPASTGTTTTAGTTAAGATGSAATPAPATEATAATLPIGATVGAAGFPTLPYALTFRGGFFDVASFIGGLDDLVHLRQESGQVQAKGRLLTVDGFALAGGAPGSSPELAANFSVTSYITPAEQGLTLGASPGGPAPAPATGQPQTTPAASTVSP